MGILLLLFFVTIRVQPKVLSKLFKRVTKPVAQQLSFANRVNEKAQSLVLQTDVSPTERVLYNFHVVEKNKLYRCAQLSPDILDRYMKQFSIRTVVNLRGNNPKEAWWQLEKEVVERHGAQFFNIAMSASVLTSKNKLLKLLEIYDTAKQPILIHCLAGVDRTGEAGALWVLEKQKKSKRQARKQFSVLPYPHSKKQYPAKDFLIDIWQGREWLKNQYDPKNYPQFTADDDRDVNLTA